MNSLDNIFLLYQFTKADVVGVISGDIYKLKQAVKLQENTAWMTHLHF